MAFKEGVTGEHVQWFRGLVAKVRDLDVQVDGGILTPEEAFEEVDKLMDSMAKPKKAAKEPEPKKETAKA